MYLKHISVWTSQTSAQQSHMVITFDSADIGRKYEGSSRN